MSMDGYFNLAYGFSFSPTRRNLELISGSGLTEFDDGDFFDRDEAIYSIDLGDEVEIQPYFSEGIDDDEAPAVVYLRSTLIEMDRFDMTEKISLPTILPEVSETGKQRLLELKEKVDDGEIVGPEYLYWVTVS